MESYTKKTRDELIAICKEQKIKGYSSMKKDEIIQLLQLHINSSTSNNSTIPTTISIGENTNEKIKFINLFCGIGSFHYSFK